MTEYWGILRWPLSTYEKSIDYARRQHRHYIVVTNGDHTSRQVIRHCLRYHTIVASLLMKNNGDMAILASRQVLGRMLQEKNGIHWHRTSSASGHNMFIIYD